MFKKTIRIVRKIIKWTLLSIVSLLLIIILLFSIPAVQTYVAQKAAAYLSKEMGTEVSIEKLRISWDFDIIIEKIMLKDLHGHTLIAGSHGRCDFPKYNQLNRQLTISNIRVEDAEVFIAKYKGEDDINLRFFINYIKLKKRSERKIRISLQNIELRNGKFTFYNEPKLEKDKEGHWNYANIVIDSIYSKIDELLIIHDSLNFKIRDLRGKERSGFGIEQLKGKLRISNSGLYCFNTVLTTQESSQIHLDFGFKYNSYSDFSDFENNIIFDCKIHPSTLFLSDLGYFAPALKGMKGVASVQTTALYGPLVQLSGKNIKIQFDKNNVFQGNIQLSGLPDIASTRIKAAVHNLEITPSFIQAFVLPNDKQLQLPAIVNRFQWVKVNGNFEGLYSNFIADADIKTDIGNGSFKEVSIELGKNTLSYKGKFNVENLSLNQLINYKDIGNISASGKVNGNKTGIDTAFIHISKIEYKNNPITNIDLMGDFHQKQLSFSLVSNDKNLKTDINGMINFNNVEYEYTFVANIDTLNLSNLHLARKDSNAIVTASGIIGNIKGNTFNSLEGNVQMINLNYSENDKIYYLDNLQLSVGVNEDVSKNISFKSNSININLNGHFLYEELIPLLQNQLHAYLPHAVAKSKKTLSDTTYTIDLQINMLKAIPLLEVLFPKIIFPEGFQAKAHLNSRKNNWRLNASMPSLKIKQQIFKDIAIQSYNINELLMLNTSCDSYWFENDTIPVFNNINLQSETGKDTVHFTVKADGLSLNTIKDALIQGNVVFNSSSDFFCTINDGNIIIATSTFLFNPNNYIHFSKDSIYFKNVGLHANHRRIELLGALSSLHNTVLNCEFNKINLEDFDLILKKYKLTLAGEATGKASLVSNQYGYNVIGDVNVNQFAFNDVLLGEFQGKTIWQNDKKKLWITASIIPDEMESQDLTVNVYGYFDPIEKFIDLKGDIQEFNIKTLAPYIQFFAHKVEGIGTGFLTFRGPIKSAKLNGNIHLTSGMLGVDFLNTEYKIKQCNIEFIDTCFILKNIVFKDIYNNTGTIDGIITHHRLKDWGTDISIKAQQVLALNTTYKHNNLFFGKCFATGDVNIKTEEGVTWIIANVTSDKNTNITINMDWNTTVKENKFIIFEKTYEKTITTDTIIENKINDSKLGVSLNIKATPDALVRVELDPSIGGTLIGTGNGNLRLDLTPDDKFEMYGTYVLNDGSFELNLGDILARSFNLEKGGSVRWNGNPTEGIINVKASYPTRVSISDLLADANTSTKTIPVNSLLYLNGKILNPEFNFGIELLDVDENIKTLVYNSIDTTDRKQMVSQTFSMLLLGRFESSNANIMNTGNFIAGLGYSMSDLASHYLNKWMSNITDKVNLGFSYRPGDGTTISDDYNVQISTNLFDNKLSIQGSLDIYDNNEQKTTGNIGGDFIVEYKITKDGALRIKAFGMSNYKDILPYTSNNEPYSQGLGLTYTKNFNTLKELFTKKKKKKKTLSD